ncbi:hypothetical protein XI08_01645 [Bradyrhizobium sp. CCBAU 11361]|nr:hypothetical protein [Bradyrhizobium sp. CCBAU 11361]
MPASPLSPNDNIGPDTPLRLRDAVACAFPFGGMTESGLRREAKAGRLVVERIANKDFTSLRAVEEMRKLCRVEVEGRAFGGEVSDARQARSLRKDRGSLSTVGSISPRDALQAKIDRRKSA